MRLTLSILFVATLCATAAPPELRISQKGGQITLHARADLGDWPVMEMSVEPTFRQPMTLSWWPYSGLWSDGTWQALVLQPTPHRFFRLRLLAD